MKKKIIFFDIDGTLVNFDGSIEESTKEALQLLKENEHLRFICTGRTKSMLPKNIIALDFDGYVLGGGTHVEYQNEDLYYHEINSEELQKTIEILQEYNSLFTLEGKDYLYVEKEAFSDERPYFGSFIKSMGKIVKPIEDICEYHVSKITFFVPPEEQRQMSKIVEKLESNYQVIVHESTEKNALTNGLVELVPLHCDKSTGIMKCIEHLNIPREDTFALGDSNNDLQMLTYVKNAICMGNGNDSAKEVADYITGSIDENGVYDGLKHFGLI